jgi:class 3 adenylate cyclase
MASLDKVLAYRQQDLLTENEVAEVAEVARAADDPLFKWERSVDRIAATEPGSCLVVDDNPTNRDILCRLLLRQGHKVATAVNGRQALDMLQAEPFDLVLLDIMMPELNGFQVLDRLKADEHLRDVPVIMISALDQDDAVLRCIAMGAEDYLPKPFNPLLLKARIGASLEKKRFRDKEQNYLRQIEQEKRRSDELLHVILPDEIVAELKATNEVKPRRYDNVAVLFADLVGFTHYCENHAPEEVVPYLQNLVEAWENSALRHGVEKIKTIGDAFMAASGLLKPEDNPVLPCVRCGLEMIEATQRLPVRWNLRVGIHVGQVMAGVIGRRQYLFDLWGDTVNTAARMESSGRPGHITLSPEAWALAEPLVRSDPRLSAAPRQAEVKSKGWMTIHDLGATTEGGG